MLAVFSFSYLGYSCYINFHLSYMTGDPMQSKDPKAWERFKSYPSGYHRRGRGAVIPCFYEFEVKPKNIEEVYNAINDVIKESDMPERLVKIDDKKS